MNFVNIKYCENEQSVLLNKDESKEEIIKSSPKKSNSELFGSEKKDKENYHNDENKNSKNTPSSIQVLSSVINEFSPKKSNTFGNYLISPIKDLKFRENAFTPLKNDSRSSSYSPSMKFGMKTESPFDRINQSSAKISYQILQSISPRIIQGKRINFNNIDQINNNNTNINININYNIESQNQLDKSTFSQNKYKHINQSFSNSQNSSKHNLLIENKHVNNNNIEQNKLICTCTKTNCKKKYCACYANGRYCEGCQCENCENKMPINKNILTHEINGFNININNIVCNCTKSNCRKKYCECYKGGKECSWMCRCVNCENCISKTIRSHLFQIEAVGIEIHDNIMYIRTRNVIENDKMKCNSKEEIFTPVKMCNKKRERTKTAEATTNMKTINIHSTSQKTCSHNKKEILKEKSNVTRKRLII